ncbi:hypothetical protein ACJJI3_10065 [Microbulbifer sp. ZKSA004]|uniref:hypothetical protein n=1 Tax=Microbulbifer sp. ZKSA004 TaxID=3243389 RepID=UPI004039D315
MAYNLHIEKLGHWDSEENRISEAEWLNICKNDQDLKIETEISGVNPYTGEEISMPGILCHWTDSKNGTHVFSYNSGRITFGGEDAQIPKAKEIASKVGAVVVGDEGEEY